MPTTISAGFHGKRKVHTYAYLHRAVEFHVSAAKETQKGQFYALMSALVFTAFMVEAFLNHVGALKIPNWEKKERRLSQKTRLEAILEAVDLSAADLKGKDKALETVFTFRDALAHGKTASLSASGIVQIDWANPDIRALMPKTEWEKLCSVEAVEPLVEDCKHILAVIHRAAGLGGALFGSFGLGSYSLSQRHV